MEKIKGVNLGNWLVLEKWMEPAMFRGVDAEDETWLNRRADREMLKERMKKHRDTYVEEKDFSFLKDSGITHVRIPVPYFIFGDREPFIGCIEYLDKAFDWAETYGIKILVDLHTTPGGQNGYDNGGICGVCKWHKSPEEVDFVLDVLKRLAERYKDRSALFGIEVVNEPISFPVYMTSPTHNKWVDPEEGKGSSFVPMSFLKAFYKRAYDELRKILPKEVAIVFHDGFRLGSWNRFFKKNHMENVFLDTHIYIFAMENFVPIHKPFVYNIYLWIDGLRLKHAGKAIPVIVGEWCICNRYAANERIEEEERKKRFNIISKIEQKAWEDTAGWFYWNYQLLRDETTPTDEFFKESWDFKRSLKRGWISVK
ncbi:MAG: cellulase family glycosylhydrolase [Lachnospiraceae bacterium]|nr:cellulase family glycosylhydrolase [Lachnospiraceae bacterium]